MKRSFQLLTLLCTLCMLQSDAYAKDDGHDRDRTFIINAYASMDKAWKDRNADEYTKYVDDTLVLTTNSGQKTLIKRGKLHQLFSYQVVSREKLDAHTTVSNIGFDKQSAIVTCKATFNHYNALNGKVMHSVDVSTHHDTWRKFGNGWRLHYLDMIIPPSVPVMNLAK